MNIDQVIDRVLAAEGGYVNDARDAGGETNWGITIATARANGYTGEMRDLPKDRAREIYHRRYVVAPGFDKIGARSPVIGAELVDTGVNMGPVVAGQFLQRSLNALNNQGRDYGELVVDGQCGPATVAALDAFLDKRGREGERRLLALLNALQGARYVAISEARPANEGFMFGWLDRIAA